MATPASSDRPGTRCRNRPEICSGRPQLLQATPSTCSPAADHASLATLGRASLAARPPMRRPRPIAAPAAVGGHLPRHRRHRHDQPAGDRRERLARAPAPADLLTLRQRQPTSRRFPTRRRQPARSNTFTTPCAEHPAIRAIDRYEYPRAANRFTSATTSPPNTYDTTTSQSVDQP